jgi:uncharacterized membrane protein YjjB (DUF3815 family)
VIEKAILCFVGASLTGILFSVPRRALLACGILGTLAWLVAELLMARKVSPIAASFMAAFMVEVLAEVLARAMKLPAICFSIVGVIPLVPGVSAYNAMYAFVMDQHDAGTSYAMRALLVAAAISAGLVMAGSIFRLLGGGPAREEHTPRPGSG